MALGEGVLKRRINEPFQNSCCQKSQAHVLTFLRILYALWRGELFRQAMTPIGVFFTAIFPLEVNEQALCQQPQVGPKSSGFGELPNKHFCGPAACKNFGVWLHPNCLPFRASPKMAQKTEVTLSYAPSVSRACLSPSTVAFTTVSSFSVIELSKTSIAFGSCSHL